MKTAKHGASKTEDTKKNVEEFICFDGEPTQTTPLFIRLSEGGTKKEKTEKKNIKKDNSPTKA